MPDGPTQSQASRPELVFALVAPLGTDLAKFQGRLENELRAFAYDVNIVRLSTLLPQREEALKEGESVEGARLRRAMAAGTDLREKAGTKALITKAIASINRTRAGSGPRFATAHVLNSLKHPEEVRTLRRVYGQMFYLIGVTSDPEDRVTYLQAAGLTQAEIEHRIEQDEDEGKAHGQLTRETFHLADVFIPQRDGRLETSLRRFLELVFGFPAHTPTSDERNMFLAYAASLSSQSLARQVGAAIVNNRGDVVAVGCNEVPRANGGIYASDSESDARDWARGIDSNDFWRNQLIQEVVTALRPDIDVAERLTFGQANLRATRLFSLTEFSRQVHAEMDALSTALRNCTSVADGTLYTTTFPCHNCAKHIVTSGLKNVVYIEPYPKSLALDLHNDSIAVVSAESTANDKVSFRPFIGVGPRRYFDLFSMTLSTGYPLERKESGTGKALYWKKGEAKPRVATLPISYIEGEEKLIEEADTQLEDVRK